MGGGGKEGACHVIRTCKAACSTWGLPTYGMKCVGQWKCSIYFVRRHSNFAVHFKSPNNCLLCKARPNIASNRYLCGQYSMTAVWCCVVLCGDVWCCVVMCDDVWCCVCRLLRSGLKRSNSDPGNVARSKRQLGEQRGWMACTALCGLVCVHLCVCHSVCPCVCLRVCRTRGRLQWSTQECC